jgi:hypothetical protein
VFIAFGNFSQVFFFCFSSFHANAVFIATHSFAYFWSFLPSAFCVAFLGVGHFHTGFGSVFVANYTVSAIG